MEADWERARVAETLEGTGTRAKMCLPLKNKNKMGGLHWAEAG